MNSLVADVWSCFAVVNPHEFIAITTVYGGPIGGLYGGLIGGPYGGPIGGFDGVGGIFAMFLYKIIVIRTWFSLALLFFISFLYNRSVGVYLMNQWFSNIIDCSTVRGRDNLFKTGMTVYIWVLFNVTVYGSS